MEGRKPTLSTWIKEVRTLVESIIKLVRELPNSYKEVKELMGNLVLERDTLGCVELPSRQSQTTVESLTEE